ncbi:carbonic anhydrase [Hyphomicrobium sp.]|uniref:carbonic anhydrase n=1 Tax=Hyphomicrobium sp. TaxID=82 RepID=UPI0025C08E4E|nr:carbonic anhydrase [Hyphomicrobium sp.]MCC7252061.1 carbonic anhydrase [Hyphomicrobium sp.]
MPIERRVFLRYATLGCACCLAEKFTAAAAGEHGDGHATPHWSYEGETGPERWGELTPEFKVCQLGLEQTPIDLTSAMKGEADGSIAFDYCRRPLRLLNNGHTIQANVDSGCACTIGGTRYDLVQFHFHHPSEHLLDGKAFEMEVHFVHRSAAGALAVVGVFIRSGAYNHDLQPLFGQMPKSEGTEVAAAGACDPVALLPAARSYFRYAGSLTTPPCSEGLTWTVFRDPIEASPEQIRQFAAIFPNNARPVQPKNRRFLIETSS